MYTMLDDQRQAKFIIKYLQENPNASIKEIVYLFVNWLKCFWFYIWLL